MDCEAAHNFTWFSLNCSSWGCWKTLLSIAASFAVASFNGTAATHMGGCCQLCLVFRGLLFCQRTTAFSAPQISQHFVSVVIFIF